MTAKNRPVGIVTERDLMRRVGKGDIYFRDVLLEDFASCPLITAQEQATVEDAAQIMLQNKIRKLPIVKKEEDNTSLVGIVTVTDLAWLLLPTRRPGLTLSTLRIISRDKRNS